MITVGFLRMRHCAGATLPRLICADLRDFCPNKAWPRIRSAPHSLGEQIVLPGRNVFPHFLVAERLYDPASQRKYLDRQHLKAGLAPNSIHIAEQHQELTAHGRVRFI
jgi:hypothetical protein